MIMGDRFEKHAKIQLVIHSRATEHDAIRTIARISYGRNGKVGVCAEHKDSLILILVDNVRNTSYVIRTNYNSEISCISSS